MYHHLLTFYSTTDLPRTVSEMIGYFSRKSPIFPTQCILRPTPLKGWRGLLGIGYRRSGSTRMGLASLEKLVWRYLQPSG